MKMIFWSKKYYLVSILCGVIFHSAITNNMEGCRITWFSQVKNWHVSVWTKVIVFSSELNGFICISPSLLNLRINVWANPSFVIIICISPRWFQQYFTRSKTKNLTLCWLNPLLGCKYTLSNCLTLYNFMIGYFKIFIYFLTTR